MCSIVAIALRPDLDEKETLFAKWLEFGTGNVCMYDSITVCMYVLRVRESHVYAKLCMNYAGMTASQRACMEYVHVYRFKFFGHVPFPVSHARCMLLVACCILLDSCCLLRSDFYMALCVAEQGSEHF